MIISSIEEWVLRTLLTSTSLFHQGFVMLLDSYLTWLLLIFHTLFWQYSLEYKHSQRSVQSYHILAPAIAPASPLTINPPTPPTAAPMYGAATRTAWITGLTIFFSTLTAPLKNLFNLLNDKILLCSNNLLALFDLILFFIQNHRNISWRLFYKLTLTFLFKLLYLYMIIALLM